MSVAPAIGYSAGAAPYHQGTAPGTGLAPNGEAAWADSGAPWADRDRKETPSKAIAEDRKCSHVKGNAERCGAFKVNGSDYCRMHGLLLGVIPSEG